MTKKKVRIDVHQREPIEMEGREDEVGKPKGFGLAADILIMGAGLSVILIGIAALFGD